MPPPRQPCPSSRRSLSRWRPSLQRERDRRPSGITCGLRDGAPGAGRCSWSPARPASNALGKPVTYKPISVDEFTERLRKRGRHEHAIQHLRAVAIDYRNGVFAGTNDIVKTVGGRDPQTVQEFVTRNKKYYDDKSTTRFP